MANGETCKAKFVTHLPFHTLSISARQAETFTEFPHSLMSVGKTADNGMITIFTKEGVTVHKEQDILITCKGKPILIRVCDNHGRYCIPLVQQHDSGKQTAYTICHQQNKLLNGCTQFVDTLSSQHGQKQ